MSQFLKINKYEVILFLLIVVYALYFTTASFLRYDNFYTGRFDLGNMVQAVWNTSQGRPFEAIDPSGTGATSRLSGHADFILVLISPLYLIWQNPKLLLLIQTIVLSLGAYFVFQIAQKILKNKNFSLLLGISFLFNPALQHTNLFEFHAVTLATTFLLAAFYFMIQSKYKLMVIFLVLSGLCKENIWLITSFFGVYLFFFKKERFLGSLIFIISLSLFYFLIWIAIPAASAQEKHFAVDFYSDYGDSPQDILRNLFFKPLNTIKILFGESQLLYLKQLFIPLGLLPIFSPFILVIVPELILLLISQNSQLHQIYYQYSATLTPFLFISAIFGIKNLLKINPKINLNFAAFYVLIFTLVSSYLFGPLPTAKFANTKMFTNQLSYASKIDEYLGTIDKKYSVASTNNLGSHLSERRYSYNLPIGVGQADFVLFLIRKPYDEQYKIDDAKVLQMVTANKKYTKIYEYQEFVVFKKVGLN